MGRREQLCEVLQKDLANFMSDRHQLLYNAARLAWDRDRLLSSDFILLLANQVSEANISRLVASVDFFILISKRHIFV